MLLEIFLALVVFLLAAVTVFYLVGVYNGLVVLRNNVEEGWANMDVLLKQRSDLIPNLVEMVKGYMAHERGTLEKVTRLRAVMMSYKGPRRKAGPSEAISSTLRSIFVVVENYPGLRASKNFIKLQKQLSAIENQLAARRMSYNNAVVLYNTRIGVLPDSILAAVLGYKKKEYFRTEKEKSAKVQPTK